MNPQSLGNPRKEFARTVMAGARRSRRFTVTMHHQARSGVSAARQSWQGLMMSMYLTKLHLLVAAACLWVGFFTEAACAWPADDDLFAGIASQQTNPHAEVLADLARELGDSSGALVAAWSCLKLSLAELPADPASKVRTLKLDTDFAKSIPGGPKRSVEIMAAQMESRRTLLKAVAEQPDTVTQAADSIVKGAAALRRWWQVHRYVGTGRAGDPFQWAFIHPSQLDILKQHVKKCAAANPDIVKLAAPKLAETGLLAQAEALKRLRELTQ